MCFEVLFSKELYNGNPNMKPQKHSRVEGPGVFLLYSWGSLFEAPILIPLKLGCIAIYGAGIGMYRMNRSCRDA